MLFATGLNGIASQNNSAVVIEDDRFKTIKSNPDSNVFLLKYADGKLNKELLDNKDYLPLSKLL